MHNEEFDEESLEEYCDDPSNDFHFENEEEYTRMLAESGEGLLMEENEDMPLIDDDIDIF